MIEAGIWEPGAPLRQEEVAERLGVSRIPVRESLRILEAEGLVSVRPNRGAIVTRPTADEVTELFELRRLLEGDLLKRAGTRLTWADLRRLAWLDEQIGFAETSREWVQGDEEFHMAMYAPAKRPKTLALVGTLRRCLNAYYVRFLEPHTRGAAWAEEHRRMIECLREQRIDDAIGVLDDHLRSTCAVLVDAVRDEA